MLDEHYGMVMIFNTLSKELCFLKQGSGENVATFRVWEYPGRNQQEHVEEMKWDHFCDCLNPKYQCMLAHKVDGEHPTSYSYLLLAVWKLERWREARDPLLPKTTTTGGSNVTQPLTLRNLFPSRKLKGNSTFTAQSAIVESIGTEGDSSVKPEREEEAGSSEEDPETLSGIDRADQPIGYIVHFTNAIKLYQKKNWNCFRCGSPDHLVKDCPKDLSKTARKASLNTKGEDNKEGRLDLSETISCSTSIPRGGFQSLKTSQKVTFLNCNPLTWWSGP